VTGEGVDALLSTIATRLPRPPVDLDVLLPYDRGDLVDRAHREGEVLAVEHVAEGSRVRLRAPSMLAHALAPYRLGDAAKDGSGEAGAR
jgi:GTP-binding protein HflX